MEGSVAHYALPVKDASQEASTQGVLNTGLTKLLALSSLTKAVLAIVVVTAVVAPIALVTVLGSSSSKNVQDAADPQQESTAQEVRILGEGMNIIGVDVYFENFKLPVEVLNDTEYGKVWIGKFSAEYADRVVIQGSGLSQSSVYLYDVLIANITSEVAQYTALISNVDSSLDFKGAIENNNDGKAVVFHTQPDGPSTEVFDIDIPESTYVAVCGKEKENGRTLLAGTWKVDGTFSILSSQVKSNDTDVALVSDTSQIRFDNSVLEVEHCPEDYFEWFEGDDQCVTVIPIEVDRSEAETYCEFINAELAYISDGGHTMLYPGQFAWVNEGNCTKIQKDGTLQTNQDCDEKAVVLCSKTPNKLFRGPGGVSYTNSVVLVRKFAQVLKYFRQPTFSEAKFTRYGTVNQTSSNIEYNLTDSSDITSVSVTVNFQGSSNPIIAIDSSAFTMQIETPGIPSMFVMDPFTLPSKVHIHVPPDNSSESICITNVLVDVGSDRVYSFSPMSLLAECTDFNVCEHGDKNCRHSLLHLDSTNNCAKLGNNAGMLRDLVIDLTKDSCQQLTTWRHESLGEPFYAEIELGDSSLTSAEIQMKTSHGSMYFDSGLKRAIVDAPKIPHQFKLKSRHNSSTSSCLKAVRVIHYDQVWSEFDMDSDFGYQCINMCSPFASSSCVVFGRNNTNGLDHIELDILKSSGCRKLVTGETISGDTIEDACTKGPIIINNDTLDDFMALLDFGIDEPYRMITAIVNSSLETSFNIPPHRGIELSGVDDESVLTGAINIVVQEEGLFQLENLDLLGNVSILNFGELEVVASIFNFDATSLGLVNQGNATIYGAACQGNNSRIQNYGDMVISYSSLRGRCILDSRSGISLKLSNIKTYDNFELLGDFDLLNIKRSYGLIDDGDCNGDDIPDETITGSIEDCISACETRMSCSGFGFTLDNLLETSCGLCLRQEDCAFDCDEYQYFKAFSRFPFTPIESCLDFAEKFDTQTVSSLHECKAWCSYAGRCEGFVYNELQCELWTNVKTTVGSCGSTRVTLHIPAPESSILFYKLEQGALIDGEPSLASYDLNSAQKCYAVCKKVADCEAFVIDQDLSRCFLYRDPKVSTTATTKLNQDVYLLLNRQLPSMEYYLIKDCLLPKSFAKVFAFTSNECMEYCDGSSACAGVAFQFSTNRQDKNCLLYKSNALVDGTFGTDSKCSSGFNLYLSYEGTYFVDSTNIDTNTSANASELIDSVHFSTSSLTLDQCKAFCFHDVNCSSFGFDDLLGSCDLGGDRLMKTRIPSNLQFEYIEITDSSYDKVQAEAILETSGNALECKMLCDIHMDCIAFQHSDRSCELLSQLSLSEYGAYSPETLHIALSSQFSDGMIAVPGHCLLETDDLLQESNCFPSNAFSYQTLFVDNTPTKCQTHCRDQDYRYYGVYGEDCWCDNSFDWLGVNITTCLVDVVCPGDLSAACNLVGLTNLPAFDLDISECKRRCFESRACSAVTFNPDTNECSFSTSSIFEACDSPTNTELFVEALEHFYEQGVAMYGDITLHSYNDSVLSLKGCQTICDVYSGCQAIYFNGSICEILGGNKLDILEESLANNKSGFGFYAARDAYLFTHAPGWCPVEHQLVTFSGTFDADTCKSLCSNHIDCGSFTFTSGECILFPESSFAESCNDGKPYYVDFKRHAEETTRYSRLEDTCLDTTKSRIDKRENVRSRWQCEQHCTDTSACSGYTYNGITKICNLVGLSNLIAQNCETNTDAFVRFDKAVFVSKANSCITNKESAIFFSRKSKEECAGLCEAWFNCRTFTINVTSDLCTLYETDVIEECPGGEVFVYYSDQQFTRLDSSFCIASNDGNAVIEVENLSIEACKSFCNIINNCRAVEHTIEGTCLLFSVTDFSNPCRVDNGRDLYISTGRYTQIDVSVYNYDIHERFCFAIEGANKDGINSSSVQSIDECKQICTNEEKCSGFQFSGEQCSIMTGTLPDYDSCDPGDVVGIRYLRNPYSLMNNTCLRNEVMSSRLLLDRENYECMALCDAHPDCAHFLYGDSESTDAYLQSRECKLFGAQTNPLDDCNQFEGANSNKSAYVNARAFIDTIYRFGAPEYEIGILPRTTFQACSELCQNIEECSAIQHSWDYRKFTDGESISLFEQTRLAVVLPTNGLKPSYTGSIPENKSIIVTLEVTELFTDQLILSSSADFAEPRKITLNDQRILLLDEENDRVSLSVPGVEKCVSINAPLQIASLGSCDQRLIFEKIDDASSGLFTLKTDDGRTMVLAGAAYLLSNPNALKNTTDFILNDEGLEAVSKFSFMSDYVQLVNDDNGLCLAANAGTVEMNECTYSSGKYTIGENQSWAYIFSTKQLVKAEPVLYADTAGLDLGSAVPLSEETEPIPSPLKCVTSVGLYVNLEDCNPEIPASQKWEFDKNTGNLRQGDHCMSASGTGNDETIRLGLCVEDGDEAGRVPISWSRASTCRLNSLEKTKTVHLESEKLVQRCLVIKPGTDKNLTFSEFRNCRTHPQNLQLPLQYFYDANKARLQVVGTELCIGRDIPEKDLSSIGLVKCFDPPGQFNVHALWFNEGNEFFSNYEDQKWKLCTFNWPLEVFQTMVSDVGEEHGCSWSAYGTAYTRMYIKPSATLQEITDPNLKFQLWLWTPAGSPSRQTQSTLKSFIRKIENAIQNLYTVADSIIQVSDYTASWNGPLDQAISQLDSSADIFGLFSIALKPAEKLPYIGLALKPFRLLSKLIKGASKTTGGQLDKWIDRLQLVDGKIIAITAKVYTILDLLETILSYLTDFVHTMVDEAYKASEQAANKHLNKVNQIMKDVKEEMSTVESKIEAVINGLKFIEDFELNLKTNFVHHFKSLESTFGPLVSIAEDFGWVADILDYKFCVPYPTIRWRCVAKLFGACVLYWPKFSIKCWYVKIRDLFEAVEWIMALIFKIPITGEIARAIDDGLNKAAEKLFDFISVDLPSFDIPTTFVDEFLSKIDVMGLSLDLLNEDFFRLADSRMFSLFGGSIMDQFNKVLEPLNGSLENAEAALENIVDYVTPPGTVNLDDIQVYYNDSVPDFSTFLESTECSEYTDIQVPNLIFPDGPPEKYSVCSRFPNYRLLQQVLYKEASIRNLNGNNSECNVDVMLSLPLNGILGFNWMRLDRDIIRPRPYSHEQIIRKLPRCVTRTYGDHEMKVCPKFSITLNVPPIDPNQFSFSYAFSFDFNLPIPIKGNDDDYVMDYMGPSSDRIYRFVNIGYWLKFANLGEPFPITNESDWKAFIDVRDRDYSSMEDIWGQQEEIEDNKRSTEKTLKLGLLELSGCLKGEFNNVKNGYSFVNRCMHKFRNFIKSKYRSISKELVYKRLLYIATRWFHALEKKDDLTESGYWDAYINEIYERDIKRDYPKLLYLPRDEPPRYQKDWVRDMFRDFVKDLKVLFFFWNREIAKDRLHYDILENLEVGVGPSCSLDDPVDHYKHYKGGVVFQEIPLLPLLPMVTVGVNFNSVATCWDNKLAEITFKFTRRLYKPRVLRVWEKTGPSDNRERSVRFLLPQTITAVYYQKRFWPQAEDKEYYDISKC